MAGWSAPSLPAESYGRGLPRTDTVRVAETIAAHGALAAARRARPPARRADDRHARHARADRPLRRGHRRPAVRRGASCSASPSPEATSPGSRRAPLRDGDEWVVTGQKVWTSSGHVADLGMLARAHRLRRAQAPGHLVLRDRHAPAGHRGAAAARDDRPGDVQRGVPRPKPVSGTTRSSASATAAGRSPIRRSPSSAPVSDPAPATPRPVPRSPARSPVISRCEPATSWRASVASVAAPSSVAPAGC